MRMFAFAIVAIPLAAGIARPQDDPLPDGMLMRLGSTHLRHKNGVYPATLSPDGKLVASAGGDGLFCLWDAATGKRLLALPNTGKTAIGPDVFSHDSKLLACRWNYVDLQLWDVAKRETRFILVKDNKSPIGPPIFSPDDKLLAVSVGNSIRLFDTTTGKLVREFTRGRVVSYSQPWAFLSGRKTLVWVEDYAVLRFVDVESGKEVRRLELKDDHYAVDGMDVSPDGKFLALNQSGVVRRDQRVLPRFFRMLDLATGKELWRLPYATEEYVHRIAFAPDGKTVVRGIQGPELTKSRIELLDPATGKIRRDFKLPGWAIQCLSFSADSRVMATSGSDQSIHLWSYPELRPLLPSTGHSAEVSSLVYTPDGKLLCSAGADGKVILWDMKTGKPRNTWPIPIGYRRQIHVGRDPKHIVCSLNNLHSMGTPVMEGFALIHDSRTGQAIHKLAPVRGGTALSPDGKVFAAGGKDHDIRLWQVATGKVILACKGQKDDASALAFSPDGVWLASASVDGTVRVWCAATGRFLRTIEIKTPPMRGPWPKIEYAANLAFTPDGLCLALSYEGHSDKTEIWDVLTGTKVQSQQVKGRFYKSSFVGNGRTLLTASLENGNAAPEIFDMLGDKRLGVLPKWAAGAHVHALAPDGQTIATALQDGSIAVGKTARFIRSAPAAGPIPVERLHALWADLDAPGSKGRDAFLALASGDKDVAQFIGKRLKPIKGPDPKQLARWLVELDSESFKARRQAMSALEDWGAAVEMPLRQAYQGYQKEGRTRTEHLLAKIDKHITAEHGLRQLRAVAVLEAIGTEDARQVLENLAVGTPGARPTQKARDALAQWPTR